MKRFTGHTEPWGSFVDIKINAPDLIPEGTNKYREKSITISSVTDPYLLPIPINQLRGNIKSPEKFLKDLYHFNQI